QKYPFVLCNSHYFLNDFLCHPMKLWILVHLTDRFIIPSRNKSKTGNENKLSPYCGKWIVQILNLYCCFLEDINYGVRYVVRILRIIAKNYFTWSTPVFHNTLFFNMGSYVNTGRKNNGAG